MIAGGLFGSFVGAALFRVLQSSGQIDVVIGLLYVVILGSIGILMLKDAWSPWATSAEGAGAAAAAPQPLGRLAAAALAILRLGTVHFAGRAARARLSRRHADRVSRHRRRLHPGPGDDLSARHAGARGVGTSLFMILAVSAATTMVHALTTRAVDVVLAGLLLIGGVIGAQYGALLTLRIKPDLMRLALAMIILLVALRMALGLAWRPDEIFSIEYL